MGFQFYFCSFVTLVMVVNAVDSGSPSNILLRSDHNPKPNSIDGIGHIDVRGIPSRECYRLEAIFTQPMNIYNKVINAYHYDVYEFVNPTHVNRVPFKSLTLLKNTTKFVIEGLQYNIAYYVLISVYYNGETPSYDYAGKKHFKYEGNGLSGKFIESIKYRFAPTFVGAKVIRNQDNSYNITTRWHGNKDPDYKRYIKTFGIQISRVGGGGYDVGEEICNCKVIEHTFTSVPPNVEYQVSIYAIPRTDPTLLYLRNYASSRRFFDLH